MSVTTSLDWILIAACSWLVIGLVGLLATTFERHVEIAADAPTTSFSWRLISRVLFPLGALVALAIALLALDALRSLGGDALQRVLPLGLPDLPCHLRLDALSAFFLFLLGATAFGISLYAGGYFRPAARAADEPQLGLSCLLYHAFLASMAFVLLADDGYAFMLAWESMALTSFFLVTAQHGQPEIRRAGYLYLLIAHVGAVGILLSFGIMAGDSGDYTFDAMRHFVDQGYWPSAAFLLAVLGFGAKAGLLTLHVWLPEAHPAAPSPVSAMMSGVMLKTAIYGLLRVCFDLLHAQTWWWGSLLLLCGLATALFGVIYATVQIDMKRLLAYSSIENVGLIVVGFGLTLVFKSFQLPNLAALTLTATLYHCLNHAFFKSLLFLATGAVLHATGERNLGKLGGLIRHMPWVAWLALLGALASAGLPPLNGFVSEWLLLQSFLFTSALPHGYLNMLLPVVAAAIALVAALAGYAMVKFFGIIFLGQPREARLTQAHDANLRERLGLLWLALGCVLLGLLPNVVIALLEPVTTLLVGSGLRYMGSNFGWWLLSPISEDRASYSPMLFCASLLLFTPFVYWAVRRRYHGRLQRGPAWDCGFPLQTSRMQDSAEGFGQPIRRIFSPFFKRTREHPSPFDARPHYRSVVEDPFWYWLYLPLTRLVDLGTRLVAFLQRGRIAIYLLYSFATLLTLLVLARG